MDKSDIINSSLKLFYAKGYNATSMEDIAEDLGIKKASLYYHIKGKQDLLYEMIKSIGLKLLKDIEQIKESDKSIHEKLATAFYTYTLTCLKNIEYTAIIHDEIKALDLEQRKVIKNTQVNFLNIFKQMIAEELRHGFIVELDVNILTHIALGTCTWGYKWFKHDKEYSPEELAVIICNFVMKSIYIKEPLCSIETVINFKSKSPT